MPNLPSVTYNDANANKPKYITTKQEIIRHKEMSEDDYLQHIDPLLVQSHLDNIFSSQRDENDVYMKGIFSRFGWKVKVSKNGKTLVVTDPYFFLQQHKYKGPGVATTWYRDSRAHVRGCIVIFRYSDETQSFDVNNPTFIIGSVTNKHFGWSIAVSDDGTMIAVGDPYCDAYVDTDEENYNIVEQTGNVSLFVFIQEMWKKHSMLFSSSENIRGDKFGWSLDMADNKLAVGSIGATYSFSEEIIHQGYNEGLSESGIGFITTGVILVVAAVVTIASGGAGTSLAGGILGLTGVGALGGGAASFASLSKHDNTELSIIDQNVDTDNISDKQMAIMKEKKYLLGNKISVSTTEVEKITLDETEINNIINTPKIIINYLFSVRSDTFNGKTVNITANSSQSYNTGLMKKYKIKRTSEGRVEVFNIRNPFTHESIDDISAFNIHRTNVIGFPASQRKANGEFGWCVSFNKSGNRLLISSHHHYLYEGKIFIHNFTNGNTNRINGTHHPSHREAFGIGRKNLAFNDNYFTVGARFENYWGKYNGLWASFKYDGSQTSVRANTRYNGSDVITYDFGRSMYECYGQTIELLKDDNIMAIGTPRHSNVEIWKLIDNKWTFITYIQGKNLFGFDTSLYKNGNEVRLAVSHQNGVYKHTTHWQNAVPMEKSDVYIYNFTMKEQTDGFSTASVKPFVDSNVSIRNELSHKVKRRRFTVHTPVKSNANNIQDYISIEPVENCLIANDNGYSGFDDNVLVKSTKTGDLTMSDGETRDAYDTVKYNVVLYGLLKFPVTMRKKTVTNVRQLGLYSGEATTKQTVYVDVSGSDVVDLLSETQEEQYELTAVPKYGSITESLDAPRSGDEIATFKYEINPEFIYGNDVLTDVVKYTRFINHGEGVGTEAIEDNTVVISIQQIPKTEKTYDPITIQCVRNKSKNVMEMLQGNEDIMNDVTISIPESDNYEIEYSEQGTVEEIDAIKITGEFSTMDITYSVIDNETNAPIGTGIITLVQVDYDEILISIKVDNVEYTVLTSEQRNALKYSVQNACKELGLTCNNVILSDGSTVVSIILEKKELIEIFNNTLNIINIDNEYVSEDIIYSLTQQQLLPVTEKLSKLLSLQTDTNELQNDIISIIEKAFSDELSITSINISEIRVGSIIQKIIRKVEETRSGLGLILQKRSSDGSAGDIMKRMIMRRV